MGKSTKTSGDNPRRNKCLTQYERGKIIALLHKGKDISEIARDMDRSWDCISYYKRNRDTYGRKHSPGPPRKLTDRVQRHIEMMITEEGCHLTEIQRLLRMNDIANVSTLTLYKHVSSIGKGKQPNIKRKRIVSQNQKLKRPHKMNKPRNPDSQKQLRIDTKALIFIITKLHTYCIYPKSFIQYFHTCLLRQ